MLIAQLSDPHIKPRGRLAYRRVDTAAALAAVVDTVNALVTPPDVVLVTGDLVDAGRPEEYGLLREILQPLKAPLFAVPGNHDDRAAMAAAFGDALHLPQDGGFLHFAVEDWPVRLIGLDTVLPGQGGGLLCPERLRWLGERLAEQPDRPTVLFQHHPPFRTGIGHMDRIGLAGAADQAAVVRRHPQVERVLCGHLHRPIQVRWAGTLASTAPGTSHQVALDLRDNAPSAFVLEPPGFQLHLWTEENGLVSHTATVGAFEGPHPFFEDGKLID
ncbi:phosphodiesterase [Azospirillum sp. TSO22-1]|uniref:phosphodiesterase n=1 Tax=Azospirillum sp. TSO22-1 TaxID=716789 RepID=UPI000D608AAE|nr:phosphodiesterase [Azospirillum sp. TSO22-1]PWC40344.1 metallophosphatase [Azospirillum sp. TSO22-1]